MNADHGHMLALDSCGAVYRSDRFPLPFQQMQVLSDIGAETLSVESLLDDKDHAARFQTRIEAEIDKQRSQLSELLDTHFPDLSAARDTVDKLEKELQEIEVKLNECERETNLQIELLSCINSDHSLVLKLESKQAAHSQLLSWLAEGHALLHDLETCIDAASWSKAVATFTSVKHHLALRKDLHRLEYTRELASWCQQLESRLLQAVETQLSHSVAFEADQCSIIASSTDLKHFFDLADTLAIADRFVRQTCTSMLSTLVIPYLRDGSSRYVLADGQLRLDRNNPEIARLDSLHLLTELCQSSLPKVQLVLFPLVLDAVVAELLLPSLPSSASDMHLRAFLDLLACAVDFEAKLAIAHKPIRDWSLDVTTHWLQSINMSIATDVQAIVRGFAGPHGWDTVYVECRMPTKAGETIYTNLLQRIESLTPTKGANKEKTAQEADDGWGLDEPEAGEGETENVEVVEEDDAWGLDDAPIHSSPTSSKGKQKATAEDDAGWGFVDDAGPEPTTSSDSTDRWDWQDHTSTSPTESWSLNLDSSISAAPKPRGRRKLGAKPASQPISLQPTPEKAKEPPQKTHRTEQIAISLQTQKLLPLMQHILALISQLAATKVFTSSRAETQAKLLKSFLDVIDYFRATMVVAHPALLQIPALAMQHVNDCIWLASQAIHLYSSDSVLQRLVTLPAPSQTFARLVFYARLQFTDQIQMQRNLLLEMLADTRGFQDIGDQVVYASSQRAVKQIVHTIQRLQQVWKPIMASSVFYEALGSLVTDVLLSTMTAVENQADIGEEESKRLNSLCKMLHELEVLFTLDGESFIHIYVGTLWFKFAYLSEILDASMVDIMFLFSEGNLVDFSADELVKLIHALFTDSPTRQRNIEKIRQGV